MLALSSVASMTTDAVSGSINVNSGAMQSVAAEHNGVQGDTITLRAKHLGVSVHAETISATAPGVVIHSQHTVSVGAAAAERVRFGGQSAAAEVRCGDGGVCSEDTGAIAVHATYSDVAFVGSQAIRLNALTPVSMTLAGAHLHGVGHRCKFSVTPRIRCCIR